MTKTQRGKGKKSFFNKLKSLDSFGQSFNFVLPEGGRSKKTWVGCVATFITLFLTIFYGSLQFIKLINFGEPTIMVSVRDSFLDTDFEFTTEDGLMIAFAITEYDDNEMPIEDPSYGQLKAYYKSWGIKENVSVDFEELPTTYCSRSQIGLPPEEGEVTDEAKRLFFPVHKNSIGDISYYYRKFKCVDSNFLRMQGDYNAARTRSFVIQFEKCVPTEGSDVVCKSDQEIKEWL